ncbi:MAG: hypothetical protein R3C59_15895 [Planctomycetaceae bacterium]
MLSKTQIEADLIQGMRRIAVPYRKALAILRQQSSDTTASVGHIAQSATDICLQLRPAMEMITDCERNVAPLRTAWNELQQPADGELRAVIDEHAILLSELIELINGVEQRMLMSRSQLAPHVDESQRRNVMRKAYTVHR